MPTTAAVTGGKPRKKTVRKTTTTTRKTTTTTRKKKVHHKPLGSFTVDQLKSQAKKLGIALSKDGKAKTKSQLERAIAAKRRK